MKYVLTIGSVAFGGAERVITNIANWLVSHNNEVTLITIHNNDNPAYQVDERIKFVNGLNWSGKKSFFKVMRKYRSVIKKEHPDIILSFLTQVNIFVLTSVVGLHIPVVVSERNDPFHSATTRLRKFLRTIIYPIASGVVFQTQEAKDYFKKRHLKKTAIIPNPIYVEDIDFNFNAKRSKTIITAGRLFEAKNQSMLIDAFYELSDSFKDYNLVIYGEGELRDSLETQIRRLGMQERIKLPGNVKDLHDRMLKSEIFVLPSRYEGMPNVLMEAMACGMCCISTDCPCGGPRFLIKDGINGFLVENNNKETLKNKLKLILSDENKRKFVSNNAKKIYDELNPDKIYRKWESFLKDVAGK